jgi:hypothetical protein
VHEYTVAASRVEALHDPVPTPIAAACAESHDKAVLTAMRRRLDLHAVDVIAEVRKQVVVGGLEDRLRDKRAGLRQPGHR